MFRKLLLLVSIPVCQLYAQPVELDPSFANAGIDIAIFDTSSIYIDIAVQPDGKILSGGTVVKNGSTATLLKRFLPDGNIDSSFGISGKAIYSPSNTWDIRITSVAILPDGKIIAGGTVYDLSFNASYFLMKYNTDGTLDSSFNGTGIVTYLYTGRLVNSGATTIQDANLGSIVIQEDKKIVVNTALNGDCMGFFATRHNEDGSLDSSFAVDGTFFVLLSSSCQNVSVAAAKQTDGKIIICGSTNTFDGQEDGEVATMRLNLNGVIDSSFGVNGFSFINATDISEFISQVHIQPDNKIVAAGISRNNNAGSSEKGYVLRMNEDGSRDTDFGINGVTTGVLNISMRSFFNDFTFDSLYRIICTGDAYGTGQQKPFLARFLQDGSLDNSFGVNGIMLNAENTVNAGTAVGIAFFNNRIFTGGAALLSPTNFASIAAYREVTPVPVTLLQFYGKQLTNNTTLFWQVSSQENIDRYIVEKSKDGIHFNTIGFIKAGSTGNYDFSDGDAPYSSCFYRLKVLNVNGTFKYSSIIRFAGNNNLPCISIYPNPVKNVLNVMLQLPDEYSTIKIIDARGAIIKTLEKIYSGNITTVINVENLQPGIYYLLAYNSKSVQQIKFIKQ